MLLNQMSSGLCPQAAPLCEGGRDRTVTMAQIIHYHVDKESSGVLQGM